MLWHKAKRDSPESRSFVCQYQGRRVGFCLSNTDRINDHAGKP